MDIQERILEIVLDLQSEHDRMLSLLLDTRSDVRTLNGRMDHVEDTSEKMYQMMDTFLLESRHHGAEITANRSRCDHLDSRITTLEESHS